MLRPPPSQTAASLFARYELDSSFDEMFAPGHAPRDAYRLLFYRLLELPATEWRHRHAGLTDVDPGIAAAIGLGMLAAVCLFPRLAWRKPPQPQPA